MTSPYGLHRLRVEVPTLEPDAVLLDQLVSLSSATAPATTSSRASSMKVLLAAAGVAVVATTTWAAGAVPGKLFPARPASHPHTVVTPTSAPSRSSGPQATRTPGASHPTSEAPGVQPIHTPAARLPPSFSAPFGVAPHRPSRPTHDPERRHPHHHTDRGLSAVLRRRQPTCTCGRRERSGSARRSTSRVMGATSPTPKKKKLSMFFTGPPSVHSK